MPVLIGWLGFVDFVLLCGPYKVAETCAWRRQPTRWSVCKLKTVSLQSTGASRTGFRDTAEHGTVSSGIKPKVKGILKRTRYQKKRTNLKKADQVPPAVHLNVNSVYIHHMPTMPQTKRDILLDFHCFYCQVRVRVERERERKRERDRQRRDKKQNVKHLKRPSASWFSANVWHKKHVP